MGQLSVDDVKKIAQSVLAEQPVTMNTTEGPIELLADEVLLSAQSAEGIAARTEDGLVVGITTEITPELRDRGIARELVRGIGELRKKAGCKVSDRVRIGYATSDATAQAAIVSLADYVSTETLSTLVPSLIDDADARATVELDDASIEISLKR